jgi:hypothetical protein
MRTVRVFESISIDGFFTDASGDMGWAHRGSDDPEFAAFVSGNASSGGALLFGRKTYEMMALRRARRPVPRIRSGLRRVLQRRCERGRSRQAPVALEVAPVVETSAGSTAARTEDREAPRSALRPVMRTRAPPRASARAVWKPMPEVPPVTIAVLPRTSFTQRSLRAR